MKYKKYDMIKNNILLYQNRIYTDKKSDIMTSIRNDICFNDIAMFDKLYKRCYFINKLVNIDCDGFLFLGYHDETYYKSVSFIRNMTSILSGQCVFLKKENEI